MASFAQSVAEQIDAEAHSGSGSWDELHGPSAELHQISPTKFIITIPQGYDEENEPTVNVCVITVESGPT